MNSKDYLFSTPAVIPSAPTGESERDRRLRLRAEERARKLLGNDGSAYENKEEPSKRDLIWEMKKNQRFGMPEPTFAPPMPEYQNLQAQGLYKPELIDNFSKDLPNRDFAFPSQVPEKFTQNKDQNLSNIDSYPYSIENKYKRPNENPINEYPQLINNTSLPAYSQEPVKANITKEQDDFANNLFNNLLKRPEIDQNNKKKMYAEELKRQIEEKNMRKVPESPEIGLEIGGNRNKIDEKRQYAAELEAQIRLKKNPLNEDTYQGFPVSSQGLSEREKKIKYARDLEAQIKQKKQDPKNFQFKEEEPYPFPSNPDNAKEKKRIYAQELEAQIREKNKRLPTYQEIPQSKVPYENFNYIKEDLANNDIFMRPQINEFKVGEEDARMGQVRHRDPNFQVPFENDLVSPSNGKGQVYEDPFVANSSSNSNNVDKKIRYRQELQQQIEEQKRRKEEEKRKRKLEEEVAEKRYFLDSGADPSKPIIRQKTVDPNKPSEENPQAERYKEHLQKAKSTSKADLSKNQDESSALGQKQDRRQLFEPSPEVPSVNGLNSPNNFVEYKPRNQQEYPNQYFPEPSRNVMPEFSNQNLMSDPRNKSNANEYADLMAKHNQVAYQGPNDRKDYPNTAMIETYLREIQETRLERDKAREKCLEMRELMLKEKEKNLEQLLNMARNNSTIESRPISYQEQRIPSSASQLDSRPPLYQHFRLNNYPENESAMYSEYPKQPVVPERYLDSSPINPSNLYQYPSPYQNWKTSEMKPNFYQYPENLIDVNPQSEPIPADIFEKSLAGNSKWIEVNHSKWGNVKLIDSVQVPPPEDFNKERKKWGENQSVSDKDSEKITLDQTPRFQLNSKLDQFKQLYVDDESLPSKIEHLPYERTNRFEKSQSSLEKNSIEEEIEYHSDQAYSEVQENSDKEVEQTREIVLSTPKYEEIDEHIVDSENWSESHSEDDEIEQKKLSSKGSYSKPKTFDVFKEKAMNKIENSEKKAKDEKDSEKDSEKNAAHQGRIAFSRLEEARKHAKQLKAKEGNEEIDFDIEFSKNLDSQPPLVKNSNQSSFEGRFTKLALNELRKQKVRNTIEDSQKSLANISDSGSKIQNVKNYENQDQIKPENILRSLAGMRSQSRRYEE